MLRNEQKLHTRINKKPEGIRLANSNEMTKNHENQIEEIKFEKLVQKQANLAEFFPEFQIKFLHFQILLIK